MNVPLTLHLIGLAGVSVFAVSGALSAGRKGFDLLGVAIIALATAIGGGTVRDLLLDRHPIFWIADSTYLLVTFVSAAFTVLYVRFRHPPYRALLIADALGLGFFTISGAQVAEAKGHSALIVIIMGTITGAFGGLIRDVLSAEVPLLLRRGELYATAAIVGSAVYVAISAASVSRPWSSVIGVAVVIAIRFAAIRWKLHLPVFRAPDEDKGRTTPR
jgi:uncharacterized membrane protein YeiH